MSRKIPKLAYRTHTGVTCDNCRTSGFSGLRHKCLVCYDFDLCDSCYSACAETGSHMKEHPMAICFRASGAPLAWVNMGKNFKFIEGDMSTDVWRERFEAAKTMGIFASQESTSDSAPEAAAAAAAAAAASAGEAHNMVTVALPEAAADDWSSLIGDTSSADCMVATGNDNMLLFHRVIISQRCRLFENHADDDSFADVGVVSDAEMGVLSLLLRYLYAGTVSFDNEDALVPLLHLACRFRAIELQESLLDSVNRTASLDFALATLHGIHQQPQLDSTTQLRRCALRVIARNVWAISRDQWLALPLGPLLEILDEPGLVVASEAALLDLLLDYIRTHPEYPPDVAETLLQKVVLTSVQSQRLRELAMDEEFNRLLPGAAPRACIQVLLSLENRHIQLPPGHRCHTPRFTWSRQHMLQSLVVVNPSVVRQPGDCSGSVRAAEAIPNRGQHYFEVMFKSPSRRTGVPLGHCYYIGLVRQVKKRDLDFSQCLATGVANKAHSWMLHDAGARSVGEFKHNGVSTPYAFGYGCNDVIGVFVDMDRHEMGFYKNGKWGGMAWRRLPSDHLYPAAVVYNRGLLCEIISGLEVPPASTRRSAPDSDSDTDGSDSDRGSGARGKSRSAAGAHAAAAGPDWTETVQGDDLCGGLFGDDPSLSDGHADGGEDAGAGAGAEEKEEEGASAAAAAAAAGAAPSESAE